MNRNILNSLFPQAYSKILKGVCPMCGEKVNRKKMRKKDTSMKEFMVSGLCQKCQDTVFTQRYGQ